MKIAYGMIATELGEALPLTVTARKEKFILKLAESDPRYHNNPANKHGSVYDKALYNVVYYKGAPKKDEDQNDTTANDVYDHDKHAIVPQDLDIPQSAPAVQRPPQAAAEFEVDDEERRYNALMDRVQHAWKVRRR